MRIPCCTGGLKKLEEGGGYLKVWQRQFLLRKKTRNARYSKTLVGRMKKTDSRLHNSFFNNRFLVARREFFFFSGVREQNICLFLPTRRGDPFVKETPGKRTGEKKTTAGGGSVGPTFFIRSADSLSLCVCVCVCVGIGAMLLWFLKWYDDI